MMIFVQLANLLISGSVERYPPFETNYCGQGSLLPTSVWLRSKQDSRTYPNVFPLQYPPPIKNKRNLL